MISSGDWPSCAQSATRSISRFRLTVNFTSRETIGHHAARCDSLGWEGGQRAAAAEILYYRGLSYRALGRLREADEWLARAIDFAERHGFNRTLFAAEEALQSLKSPREIPAAAPAVATSAELRIGLREMRTEAIATGA